MQRVEAEKTQIACISNVNNAMGLTSICHLLPNGYGI